MKPNRTTLEGNLAACDLGNTERKRGLEEATEDNMSATPRTDALLKNHSSSSWTELVVLATQLERELIAACEERDRHKADSLALDLIMGMIKVEKTIYGYYLSFNSFSGIVSIENEMVPEHLRKHLDGKHG